MPILNYTTTIDAHRTVTEVQRLLATHGAQRLECQAGNPTGLAFQTLRGDYQLRYRLPCRHQNILAILRKDPNVRPAQKTPAHALRVAWRIILNWCEAQMALIEAEMATIDEVFFPYALLNNDKTMHEQWALGMPQLPGDTNG